MLPQTRARLANEAAIWRHLGLIDESLAQTLAERYDARGAAGENLRKWLGLLGVFTLGAAILSVIGIAVAEMGLFASMIASAAGTVAVWHFGARLAADPRQRHPLFGAALISVGLMGLYGTLVLVVQFAGQFTLMYSEPYALLLLVTAAAALQMAYRFSLRWPLLLGLLFFFHAAGSWHAYGGHGSYFADIQDERAMAVVALLAIGVGLWHEAKLETGRLARQVGFGHLYLVFGLLYLNLSLWFLTLGWESDLVWVLIFTAAAIGQIVVGAALKDSRFTGFGIVFLSIDLYTRFFERFWNDLSAGACFAIGGGAAMAIGVLCERAAHFKRDAA